MIERTKAKNGQTILKLNGRQICTSINPTREAQDWVSKNSRRFADMKTIVVVGVGCGYHVAELHRKFAAAKIVALDLNEDLISFSRDEHGLDLVGVDLINAKSVAEVVKAKEIRDAVGSPYVVVRFNPCTIEQKSEYDEIEFTLLGRNIAGFKMIIGARARMSEIFKSSSHFTLADSRPVLSIKSLYESLGPSDSSESMMVRALRELIN